MTLVYPPNWSALRFKEMRWSLLHYLWELSDSDYQRRAWVERTIDTHIILGIDQIVHFFFDDTWLAERPDDLIGVLFFDQGEADVIKPITAALDAMIADWKQAGLQSQLAHREEQEWFIKHSRWPELVRCAQIAKALLDSRGVPEFEPK
jgi:hypothetical protein